MTENVKESRGKNRTMSLLTMMTGIIFLILFMIFLLPVFGGVLNIGNIMGMLFCGLMIFITLGHETFMKLVYSLKEKPLGGFVVSSVIIIFVLGLLYAGFLTTLIISADMTAPEENATVIVLGCQVIDDHPSLMLKNRIESAYRYLEENPTAVCIVTGGKGSDEKISEAQCMFDNLTAMGIEPDRIYLEDQAVNTVENIAFSKKIIEENNLSTNTAVVTDIFHQYRASGIVKEAQLHYGSVPAKCVWYLLPTYYVRELIAITASFAGLA